MFTRGPSVRPSRAEKMDFPLTDILEISLRIWVKSVERIQVKILQNLQALHMKSCVNVWLLLLVP
jgi:hypothetical protein